MLDKYEKGDDSMKKTDKRILSSISAINNSMIELLEHKDISRITVKEICEYAQINRSTFYAHYDNPMHVLVSIEKGLIDSINSLLAEENIGDVRSFTVQPIEKILKYILENKRIVLVMLGDNANQGFIRQLIDIVKRENFMNHDTGIPVHPDSEYIFEFLATGAVSVVRKWLKEDETRDIHEVSEMIYTISIYGQSGYMPR